MCAPPRQRRQLGWHVPLETTVALADAAGAIKDGLLAFASATGLVVMCQMMEAERLGVKHARIPAAERGGHWQGSQPGRPRHGSPHDRRA